MEGEKESALPAVTLRRFDQSDADAVMEWASDPRVTRFGHGDPYTCRDQALEYLATKVLPHPWFRAVCLDGRPVGSLSVSPGTGTGAQCRASVGYRLAYKHWGRGVMTRALALAAAEVFREWSGLERMEAVVEVNNRASQRVLEKVGFVREAVLRKYVTLKGVVVDVAIYRLLRSELEVTIQPDVDTI